MASIIGILTDKRGNVLPYVTIIVREAATDPAGDTATDVTDAIGSYNMTVSKTGTIYNVYINSEAGGISGPNYCGKIISSGDVVSSFVLSTDVTWLVEHNVDGTHSDITADSLTLNASGYLQTTDAYLDSRIGSANSVFRIFKDDSVYWFSPCPVAGNDNNNVGLRAKYDGTYRTFYFGVAKTYFINTLGSFYLNSGTFFGSLSFLGATTFQALAVFYNTVYPRLNTYIVPTDDRQFATKKYVDDEITAATIPQSYWKNPCLVLSMISDEDMGGLSPESPFAGDAYIATNWTSPTYTEGHIYEYDGVDWIDLGLPVAGTRVIVVSAGATGSFVGEENNVATYDGADWSFSDPSDGWVILIRKTSSYYDKLMYVYNIDTDLWEQIN